MLPDPEPTLQVKARRQLRVCFLSSSCSLHSSFSSLTQHLPLSPLFVAVRLIVSSCLPSCFLLAAPGCDQRLQLGVHAALQLDSRHHGPQPPHRLQSHPLWVRSAKKKKDGHCKHPRTTSHGSNCCRSRPCWPFAPPRLDAFGSLQGVDILRSFAAQMQISCRAAYPTEHSLPNRVVLSHRRL